MLQLTSSRSSVLQSVKSESKKKGSSGGDDGDKKKKKKKRKVSARAVHYRATACYARLLVTTPRTRSRFAGELVSHLAIVSSR